MKVFITGVAGFIGSNLVRYILKNTDFNIIGLDKLTYAGNINNIKDLIYHYPNRFNFIVGDICNTELINDVLTLDINAILNLAAESHVDRSILDATPFIQTNIIGTQNLLNIARIKNIQKFIQISTDEVYGSLSLSDLPFTENSPLSPNSPYAASKTGADLLCRANHKTYGQNIMITRCSNNYGPYQFPEKLIPLMTIKGIRREQLPIYGDGLQIRDWLYVDDHCDAILKVLEYGKAGEVYNIGGSNEFTNLDLIKLILKKLNITEDLITYVADRPGHDRRYAINSSKIQNECFWSPKINFNDGIEKTIEWYRTYKEWWQKILVGDYLFK